MKGKNWHQDDWGTPICDNCDHAVTDHYLGRFEKDPWLPMCIIEKCPCVGDHDFGDL